MYLPRRTSNLTKLFLKKPLNKNYLNPENKFVKSTLICRSISVGVIGRRNRVLVQGVCKVDNYNVGIRSTYCDFYKCFSSSPTRLCDKDTNKNDDEFDRTVNLEEEEDMLDNDAERKLEIYTKIADMRGLRNIYFWMFLLVSTFISAMLDRRFAKYCKKLYISTEEILKEVHNGNVESLVRMEGGMDFEVMAVRFYSDKMPANAAEVYNTPPPVVELYHVFYDHSECDDLEKQIRDLENKMSVPSELKIPVKREMDPPKLNWIASHQFGSTFGERMFTFTLVFLFMPVFFAPLIMMFNRKGKALRKECNISPLLYNKILNSKEAYTIYWRKDLARKIVDEHTEKRKQQRKGD